MSLPAAIEQQFCEILKCQVQSVRPLGGGCIHHAQRVETDRGTFFLKYNQLSQAHNFEVEAKGLALLRATESLPVPEVVVRSETEDHAYLVLEYIEPGRRTADFWPILGRGLALLHQHQGKTFGLDHDNYIGALPQINRQRERWVDFFRDERLRPMVEMAERKGLMDSQLMQQFDALYLRLPERFPDEPPALLHGDLWGGNLMTDLDGGPVLIDPAVYYGHREMELAFMMLFDRQPESFYAAYHEVYPLSPDWQQRIGLCNLYPLMVHVNLFGAGYLDAVRKIMGELLQG